MKTGIIFAAAMFVTAAGFAQSTETNNQQGATISSTAKTATEAGTTGVTVSEAASAKAQAEVNTGAADRLGRKAERKARKAEKELRRKEARVREEANSELKNAAETANNEHGVTVSTTAKTSVESGNKGATVSETASVKAQADVRKPVDATVENTQRTTHRVKATTRKVKAPRAKVNTRVSTGARVGIK